MSKDDYHKNALKTSWNDVTGDFIRTGKGGNEKYAKGWNVVFGKKEPAKLKTCIKCPRDETVHCNYCGLCQSDQTYADWAIWFKKKQEAPLTRCASHQDGDCYHKQCPQLRDNEPACSGRSCSLPDWRDDDND